MRRQDGNGEERGVQSGCRVGAYLEQDPLGLEVNGFYHWRQQTDEPVRHLMSDVSPTRHAMYTLVRVGLSGEANNGSACNRLHDEDWKKTSENEERKKGGSGRRCCNSSPILISLSFCEIGSCGT